VLDFVEVVQQGHVLRGVLKVHCLHPRQVSVSNSSSGCDWELDQVSAMGGPTHMDHRARRQGHAASR
jgi:hypothetical protein